MIMCRMIVNRAYLVGTDHYPMNVVLHDFKVKSNLCLDI